jgi:hypothetical protein
LTPKPKTKVITVVKLLVNETMGRKQGNRTDKNNSKKVDVSSEITDDILSEHYTVTGSIGDNDNSFAAWDDDGDNVDGDGTCSVSPAVPAGLDDDQY